MMHLIDAGNTAIKVLHRDGDLARCVARLAYASTPYENIAARFVAMLNEHIALLDDDMVFMSSLPQADQAILADALDAQLPHSIRRLRKADCLPHLTQWHYKTDDLGLDRMVNLVAANRLYPQKTVVILAAGTGLCVDVLHHGEHLGGWIQPGVSAWCSLLQEKAPHLPQVSLDASVTFDTFPHSTKEALHLGLLAPYCLGVQATLHSLLVENDLSPDLLVLTGGDAEVLYGAGVFKGQKYQTILQPYFAAFGV